MPLPVVIDNAGDQVDATPVAAFMPPSVITGRQALTLGAVALPSNVFWNGLVITALPTNTGIVYVGAAGVSASTGYPLSPGQSIAFGVANGSAVFILGTVAGDLIAFAGN